MGDVGRGDGGHRPAAGHSVDLPRRCSATLGEGGVRHRAGGGCQWAGDIRPTPGPVRAAAHPPAPPPGPPPWGGVACPTASEGGPHSALSPPRPQWCVQPWWRWWAGAQTTLGPLRHVCRQAATCVARATVTASPPPTAAWAAYERAAVPSQRTCSLHVALRCGLREGSGECGLPEQDSARSAAWNGTAVGEIHLDPSAPPPLLSASRMPSRVEVQETETLPRPFPLQIGCGAYSGS